MCPHLLELSCFLTRFYPLSDQLLLCLFIQLLKLLSLHKSALKPLVLLVFFLFILVEIGLAQRKRGRTMAPQVDFTTGPLPKLL